MSAIPAVQSLGPARWFLAGQVATGSGPVSSQHSLKIVRKRDHLSPQIKSAIAAKSVVPIIQIATPAGKVTLLNAKVVNVGPVPPRQNTNELEEVELTFQKIEYTNVVRSRSATDDWMSS
jgi:type VI protein secretion system component Hcp